MPDVRAIDYTGSERLTMNMGPQHPSAHGVFRAILTLEGETVVGVDAVIGYLHRCHEKLAETLAYVQYPTIASKTDYVAAMSSELAYVMAAERIGNFDVPKRDHRTSWRDLYWNLTHEKVGTSVLPPAVRCPV